MVEMQALIPNYVSEFSCLGGDCRYTCCQKWVIHFRKNDYKRLMKLRTTPEFKEKIHKMIKRLPEGQASDETYAQLDFNENGFCPLLDKNQLCSLHRTCGAEVLPLVCRQFPRTQHRILGVQEKHVRLQCEAVFRTLLLLSEGVKFETCMVPEEKGKTYYFGEEMIEKTPLLLHYWTIKTLMLGILQSSDRPIAQRILFVGLVLQRLISLQENGQLDQIAGVLDRLMQEDDSPIWTSLETLPQDLSLAMMKAADNCKSNVDPDYAMLYRLAMRRIGTVDEEGNKAQLEVEKYQAAKQDYAAFLERYPRALENIAVALFQEMAQPFGGVRDNHFQKEREAEPIDLWLNYLYFCRQFTCLQFMLGTTTTPDMELKEFCKNAALVMRGAQGLRSDCYALAEQLRDGGFGALDTLSILLQG